MASLVPFRALRPIPSSAARVAAVPYDVVDVEEARTLARAEPLSFLHVSRPEVDLPEGTNPYSDEVYARAVTNMAGLRATAPLVTEELPSLYLYRLEMKGHVQTGVAGCFSLAEYENNRIRKHERTRKDKEDDRTRHILELRAQTGPVFLTYRAAPGISALSEDGARTDPPLFDFVAGDGIRHTVWRLNAEDASRMVEAFHHVPAMYIADGHHRAASAARVRQRLRGSQGTAGEWDTFLGVAFPHDQVQVLAYNRIVKDLGPFTPESLLERLRREFVVSDGLPVPQHRGEVSVFLGGQWVTMALPDAPSGFSPDRRLDVSRLQETVLTPLLGIADITTDRRIEFVGGIRGAQALERLVMSGEAAVAFSMYPAGVDDVMQIADADGIMPPKSTWFEPKLRDGLMVHLI
jgi:uncharacterized protein (DUF1015 family)